MCGIVGAIGEGASDLALAVARAAECIAHRGPNAQGVWCDPRGRAVLGNRRLAILDLRHEADQPMQRGPLVLTYNGEIYNYVEVRAELEGLGHSFTTSGDTEVILEAFAEWGEACIDRFNGMFAFALWDEREGRLFAARDRFGEKPFYYATLEGRFLFASEIKALLGLPDVPRRPNEVVLRRFLLTGHVADGSDETFFADIRQLPAAHTLVVDGADLRCRRYWTLPAATQMRVSRVEAVERIGALFADAVRIRLRSDVPVGSSLSGGIDSSLVVQTIHGLEIASRQVAFCASYGGGPVDELRYARTVAERLGIELHYTTLTSADLIADIDRFVWHQDEPCPHTSQFAQWKVMELARANGVTVLLDGQGADEVFGGYHPRAFGGRWIDALARADVVWLARELRAWSRVQPGGTKAALRYLSVAAVPDSIRERLRAWLWRASGVVHADARTFSLPQRAPIPYRDRFRVLQAAALVRTSLPSLLRYGDRNSMAFSVESRLPFLDHRVVELAYRLPPELHMDGGWTKALLRDLLRPVLPEIADRRDKIGFATPERAWFTGDLRPWLDGVVERARARDLFDRAAVEAIRRDVYAGRAPTEVLWRVVHSELWLERFIDGPWRA